VFKIGIIGLGYVGLTTALGLAKIGHSVIGVEINPDKLSKLKQGKLPIYEPGLDRELVESIDSGRFILTSSLEEASTQADIFFICVATPQDDSGAADLSFVVSACQELAKTASSGSIIVLKSTVPVGSGEHISNSISRSDISFVSNPEFLREGSALRDFMEPDRIVVGAGDESVAQKVLSLYDSITAPKIATSVKSAELIKYAANAYLATRLSFVNDLAALCEQVGANIDDVVLGMGSDSRIGLSFLKPGPGWGGSCFPKDTRALLSVASGYGISLGIVGAAIESNEKAFVRVVTQLKDLLGGQLAGKQIATWGLAFKADTDDTRDSPALEVIQKLLSEGCRVVAYDPVASAPSWDSLSQVSSALEATRGADALLVLTEWPEFAEVDPGLVIDSMARSLVLDTRRILPATIWKQAVAAFSVLGNGSK
jgi:UDPglucose 6-dehydrogenase